MVLNQRTGFDGSRKKTANSSLRMLDEATGSLQMASDILPNSIFDLLTLRQQCHEGDADAYWTYGTKLSAQRLFVEAAEHYEAVARGDYDGHSLPAYDLCAAGEWTKSERFGRADLAFRRAVKHKVPFADTAHYDALVARGENERAAMLYPEIASHTAASGVPNAIFTEVGKK